MWAGPREGVIIEWPLNGHFNDARDVIMMFWTDAFVVVDHGDDPDLSTFT